MTHIPEPATLAGFVVVGFVVGYLLREAATYLGWYS